MILTWPVNRHPRHCRHCRNVDAYRAARIAAELARENTCSDYPTELAEYGPVITFKEWLVQTRNA